MKVIYNNLIPVKGFVAINLFGVVFARKMYEPLGRATIQHEEIHTAQMRELLYVGFICSIFWNGSIGLYSTRRLHIAVFLLRLKQRKMSGEKTTLNIESHTPCGKIRKINRKLFVC